MMKTWTAIALSMLACQIGFAQSINRPNGPTKPAHSEFFTSQAAMVLLDKKSPDALFGLTLSLDRDLPPNAEIKVQFENPALPDEFFEVAASVDARRLIMARSPHFTGITNHRAYLARTLVLDEHKQVISTHEQWIWFDMPAQLRSAYATKVID
jgi:hypothetical protein